VWVIVDAFGLGEGASAALLGALAAPGAAFGDGGVGFGARLGQRSHAAAGRRRIGAALGLVDAGFLVIAHPFAPDGVERLAADVAGDDRLPDQVELALGAVGLGAQALALDDFVGLGAFLANGDDLAFLGGGGAVLVAGCVFMDFQPVGGQFHEAARQHHIAGEDALPLHVVVVQRVGQDQRARLFGGRVLLLCLRAHGRAQQQGAD